ncbi:MAG: alpha/beta hydrolase [Candidatus Binatia bacterium]
MPFPRIPRYSAAGMSLISFDKLPTGVNYEVIPLQAEDRGESKGVLYSQGGEKTVVCLMHPRADMTRHYAIPYLLDAGYAAFGQEGRWPSNDIACIHEMLIPDIAAGISMLKGRRFQQVVCIGNSGGGSLYSFYQSQAVTNPPQRLTTTPAGDPYDLNRFNLPPLDGMVILAAHLGEGKFLQKALDPSVTDENDPLSCDPSLDMYNPANGFREPPESSKYSAEFIVHYRAAQMARVARIDAIARRYIEEQRYFQELARQPEFDTLPLERRSFIGRRVLVGRYMEIHRTEANLAYADQSICPSSRDYGSLWSPRPELFNYHEAGFGKYQTPRAWLSTWSGLSSRAAVLDCIPKITVPTLVVNYTGDHAIYPEDSESIYQQSPATDKQFAQVDADHFGYPLPSKPNQGGRDGSMKVIVEWLQERFPGR